MSLCTVQQVTELTGQQYWDTVLFHGAVTGTLAVGQAISSATGSGVITLVGAGFIEITNNHPVVQIGVEAITTLTGSTTVTRVAQASSPGRSTVSNLIETCTEIINQRIGNNGVTVTGATLEEYFMQGCRVGVAWMIENQQYLQSSQNESQRGSVWGGRWRDFLDECTKHPELQGAHSRLRSSFPAMQVTGRDQFI
jgi:hypothetical protein